MNRGTSRPCSPHRHVRAEGGRATLTWDATEYYSAFTRREIPTHATSRMNLEDIVLNEVSRSLKRQILYDSNYIKFSG